MGAAAYAKVDAFAPDGELLGSSELELGAMGIDRAMAVGLQAIRAKGREQGWPSQCLAKAYWRSASGREWLLAISVDVPRELWDDAVPSAEGPATRPARNFTGGRAQAWRPVASSLRLMPDYGGAYLWNTAGSSCSLSSAGDGAGGALAEALEQELDAWQSHFERCCGHQGDEPGQFEWGPFMGMASALALRSLAMAEAPLHVEAPYEMPARALPVGMPLEAMKSGCWLPEWTAGEPVPSIEEAEACRCLSAMDGRGFEKMLASGARQPLGRPMPWSTYCAFMGMGSALAAVVSVDPEGLSQRCLWGASMLDAAVFSASAECIAIAMDSLAENGLPAVLGDGPNAMERFALAAPRVGASEAKKALAAWVGRGGSISGCDAQKKAASDSEMEVRAFGYALGESIELDSAASLGAARSASGKRPL